MNREKYRKAWERYHRSYEKTAYKLLNGFFRESLSRLDVELLTESNYRVFTNFMITESSMQAIYLEIYSEIGLIHGQIVGKNINRELTKNFTIENFISQFQRNLLTWLIESGGQRIVTVRKSFIEYINEVIARGINDGKSMSQIATDLQKLVKSRRFYRWQSLRIARTETTTAANYAASIASEISGFVMQKVWISVKDSRTRRPPEDRYNHWDMDGVKVSENSEFIVSGEKMRFPGDPNASEGNVINCRCTVAHVPKRDSDGNLIIR